MLALLLFRNMDLIRVKFLAIVKTCHYFPVDSNLLGPDHPMRIMRTHEATNTTLCHRVRSVPDKLRLDENFYIGIDPFYTKYTEAYGIPIIGKFIKYVLERTFSFIYPSKRDHIFLL